MSLNNDYLDDELQLDFKERVYTIAKLSETARTLLDGHAPIALIKKAIPGISPQDAVGVSRAFEQIYLNQIDWDYVDNIKHYLEDVKEFLDNDY